MHSYRAVRAFVVVLIHESRRFRDEFRAVTAIEYALIASLIAIGIISSIRVLGSSTSSTFDRVATSL